MAKVKSPTGDKQIRKVAKKSRQGDGKRTKYSASSSNKPRKKSRGQG